MYQHTFIGWCNFCIGKEAVPMNIVYFSVGGSVVSNVTTSFILQSYVTGPFNLRCERLLVANSI